MNFDSYQINKNIPVPLYYQFKQLILNEINNAQPDDLLPPEEVFCEIYNISRSTVRQAILELVSEGYLYRVKSKGTFVAPPKIKSSLLDMYGGYNIEIEGLHMTPSMKVIQMEVIPATNNILDKLQSEKVLSIIRYRYADNQVMAHIQSYLTYPLCNFVTAEKLNHSSLYQILAENALAKIKRVERTIETCHANAMETKLMNMGKGGLINLCTNLGFTGENKPILYEIVKYRGDKVKYSIEINLS